jgi:hypothetical protein
MHYENDKNLNLSHPPFDTSIAYEGQLETNNAVWERGMDSSGSTHDIGHSGKFQ